MPACANSLGLVPAAHAEDRAGIGVGRGLGAAMGGDMIERRRGWCIRAAGTSRGPSSASCVMKMRRRMSSPERSRKTLGRLQDRGLGARIALALEQRDHGLDALQRSWHGGFTKTLLRAPS
jgi:hypothetical protein